MMKKKLFLLTVLMIGTMTLAAGCSSENTAESEMPVQTGESSAPEAETPETEVPEITSEASEQSTMTGVIDEIKDFMFVVTDDDGVSYAFSFEGEKPEGLSEVQAGDRVVVTYTGTVSEVDHFDGEIISVEKAE